MAKEVTVPSMGESVSTGILAAWLKNDGDTIAEGDELFELETDKATLAVPSPVAGVLSTKVEEGADIEVGQVVATVDESAAGAASSPAESDTPAAESDAATAEPTAPQAAKAALSPAVRRVVEENSLDPGSIAGTGKDGRITKADALKAAEAQKEKPAGIPAAPAVEPTRLDTASGPEQTQRREKMSNMRKRIAGNLVASKQVSAHLTTFNEFDMSAVMALRTQYKDAFTARHGVKLGFMSFFVKACVAALQEYPVANAFIDGEDIVYNNVQNIGVAVSTEKGLIVPVLKGAETKSFAMIESEIASFAVRAKERKLGPDDLMGGTFTITNGGVFGSLLSTPIPTPPQSAILGIHTIQKRPMVVDDQIVIRPMTYAALTYDHRIMDGREAVGFLVKVKKAIEDPQTLLLDI